MGFQLGNTALHVQGDADTQHSTQGPVATPSPVCLGSFPVLSMCTHAARDY